MNQIHTGPDAGLTLFILNGQHAGASVALDGHEILNIGAAVDNDVILADDAIHSHHLQLRKSPTGWQLCPGASVTLQDGTIAESEAWHAASAALRLGNIWIALVPDGMAPPEVAALERNVTEISHVSDDSGGEPDGGSAKGLRPANELASVEAQNASTPPSRRRWKRLSLLVLPTLLLPAGLLLGMTQRPDSQTPLNAGVAAAKRVLDPGLAKLLQDPRWRTLKGTPQEDGRTVISGWLPDDSALEALSMQLARIKPRPIMRVRADDGTHEAVKTLVSELSPGLHAEYSRGGVVTLGGAAADVQAIDDVTTRLKKQIPELTVKNGNIEFLPAVVEQLQRNIDARKISNVHVRWDGRQVRVSGTVSPASETQLQAVLREFDQRFHSAIPFEANLTRDLGRFGTGLPFAIRSVVGGNAPYVVLDDGTMLTPGGTYAGWRLKEVDATQLTFDAPQLLVVKR